MTIELIELNGVCIAGIISDNIELKNTQDAVDMIANCNYQGATAIILREENIIGSFFDLKTGVAGDMLQKFSTYQSRLAIVGDFTKFPANSLQDFIRESNKLGKINFVGTIEEAKNCLTKKK